MDQEPPVVVFEFGLNHLGNMEKALRMVDALVSNKATHMTVQVVVDPARFMRNPEGIKNMRSFCFTLDENVSLIRYAVAAGLQVGGVVVDPDDIPSLIESGVSFFKVLSADISHEPLLKTLAATGLPVYLSTGVSNLEDIGRAVKILRSGHSKDIVRLIHTVVIPGTPLHMLNLRNIPTLAAAFNAPVSYGQHADNFQAMYSALAIGAESIFAYLAEIREPNLPDGPHAVLFSQIPDFLQQLNLIRMMLGNKDRMLSEEEMNIRRIIRRSIVAQRPIVAGNLINMNDLAFKRPGSGIQPWDLSKILGTKASQTYDIDQDLQL